MPKLQTSFELRELEIAHPAFVFLPLHASANPNPSSKNRPPPWAFTTLAPPRPPALVDLRRSSTLPTRRPTPFSVFVGVCHGGKEPATTTTTVFHVHGRGDPTANERDQAAKQELSSSGCSSEKEESSGCCVFRRWGRETENEHYRRISVGSEQLYTCCHCGWMSLPSRLRHRNGRRCIPPERRCCRRNIDCRRMAVSDDVLVVASLFWPSKVLCACLCSTNSFSLIRNWEWDQRCGLPWWLPPPAAGCLRPASVFRPPLPTLGWWQWVVLI